MKQRLSFFCAVISKKTILTRSAESKCYIFYFTHVKDPYWFSKVE